ncbi:DUF3667 domain-containing protein [Candidatus Palauibacter sp.]|uniref:DUF3667 domain-containing protein n=1 Tax=Candidatus Palauibacter sp. TaxID=3101350 RepID=UPI003D0EC5D9
MTTAGERACANCGYEPMESFCPRCGQSDRHYARSLGSVVLEFLREMFELDSRLFRTLRLLFFKPGSLTREFSRNRRVSFVSPVRLYIFASFVFFLLLSLMGDFGNVGMSGMTEEDAEDAVTQPSDSVAQPPTEERLAAFMAALPPEQQRKADDILRRPEGDIGKRIILSGAAEEFEKWNWIGRLFVLGVIDILHDPSVIRQRLLANMPIAMFFVLPVLGLVLAIFHFRKKKRFYVEHLVFAIHIQTFTFLIYAIVLLLPDEGLGGLIRAGCLLVPYPYFVIALRRYYENGWVLSVAKSVGVYMLYSLILLPAFVISVFLTG